MQERNISRIDIELLEIRQEAEYLVYPQLHYGLINYFIKENQIPTHRLHLTQNNQENYKFKRFTTCTFEINLSTSD